MSRGQAWNPNVPDFDLPRGRPAVKIAVFAIAALLSWAPATGSAEEKTDPVRAITSELICPCSCGEILYPCTCETAKSMRAFVAGALKAGQSPEAVEAALVAQYGAVVRGAPRAEGFNLIVWVAPFVATAVGVIIATWLLLRWVRRRAPAAAPVAIGSVHGPSTAVERDDLRARAEEELRRYQR